MSSVIGWLSYGTDLTEERPAIMRLAGDDAEPWVTPRLAMRVRPQGRLRSFTTNTGVVAVGMTGELINRVPLAEALRQRGHPVPEDDDAALVLHSYLEWGESMTDRLDGGFAVVIWDERHRRLTFVRDRLGVELLYYYPLDDGVVFGSEPAALFAHDRVRRRVDLESMREIFTFTTSRDISPWKGLYQVTPGGMTTVTADDVRSHTYWRLPTRAHTDDRQGTVDYVRDRLTAVIDHQLSDMTPCVLLSGGLDSSAVTGIAASRLSPGERIHTFSVGFADVGVGGLDVPFTRDVARLVGSEHHQFAFTSAQLSDPELRRKMIMARGAPVSWGDADVSLYLAFSSIAESFDAVLSGDGADTVFGFHPEGRQEADEARMLPWQEAALCDFWAMPIRPDLRKALDLPTHLRDQYDRAMAEVEHVPGADPIDRRMREIAYIDVGWEMRTVLDRRDCIARLTGLTARVPYCDRELVEYMYNVPWALKTFDGREKSLLRQAVSGLIPESVARRTKRGYPFTQDAQYVAALQDQGREILADPGHPVFSIVDRAWLEWAVEAPIPDDSPSLRFALDRAIDLYHWLDLFEPELLVG